MHRLACVIPSRSVLTFRETEIVGIHVRGEASKRVHVHAILGVGGVKLGSRVRFNDSNKDANVT